MTHAPSRLPFLVLCSAVLTACASSADYTARMQEIERTTPVCAGDADCTSKWEAAQLWVAKNAGMKIQTVTSVLIQTYNSTDSSTRLAATVTKEPLGGGRYKIVANLRCDNIYGCRPDRLDATIQFNRAVGEARP